ncbi:YwmB family TATA-box binding protein [Cytobacillus horneckiae]|uniref:YwmB family TATA-box binding protein n=1 Tax=Cytobacillus horneckiae TaxID=549687 RepID=UPI0039A20986
MKKNSFLLSIIGIVGITLIYFGNQSNAAQSDLTLFELAQVLHDENILIQEWSIHARENVEDLKTLHEVKAYTNEVKQTFSTWEWTVQDTAEQYEAVGVLRENGSMTESIKILSTPINDEVQTYLIYEAKGADLEEKEQEKLGEKLEGRIVDIFRGNPRIFSCIIGDFSGKMSESMPLKMKELLTAFNAKEIEALKEEHFMSTSAYTPKFKESIRTNGEDMNLQIGLRKEGLGAKTTIVIGTPIITIEY